MLRYLWLLQLTLVLQSLASEFLLNHVFLSAGKVGSSTDLIVQKVEFVHESGKRDILRNLLHEQTTNGTQAKVENEDFVAHRLSFDYISAGMIKTCIHL